MNALTTINNPLAIITEKRYLQIIDKARNLRRSFKVGVTDEDLLYVLAQNKALERELNQVTLSSIVDADYLAKVSDINVLFNNMFVLPDALNQIFISRTPFIIFDVDEKDISYLENLKQKISLNLSQGGKGIEYAIKVYVNIPNMMRYQVVVKDIKNAIPDVEIISYISLVDQFDTATMLEVPSAGEAAIPKGKLFANMQPLPDKYLLLTNTNFLGKNTEKNNYYKLRKFLGDIIISEDASEALYARNLVKDYFFSDYLTVTERLRYIFECPSLIQLGEFFFVPCYIQKVEVHATVLSVERESRQELLVITKDCAIEPVDEEHLLGYLRQDTRFINFSLTKINGKVYFIGKYEVELFTTCLSNYGIDEMQYTLRKTLPTAVRFITDITDKEVYASTKVSYNDFRETRPHPLTREIVMREVNREDREGIWAERNSGLNFSHNLACITPFIPIEELLKNNYVCPKEGFKRAVVNYTWR